MTGYRNDWIPYYIRTTFYQLSSDQKSRRVHLHSVAAVADWRGCSHERLVVELVKRYSVGLI